MEYGSHRLRLRFQVNPSLAIFAVARQTTWQGQILARKLWFLDSQTPKLSDHHLEREDLCPGIATQLACYQFKTLWASDQIRRDHGQYIGQEQLLTFDTAAMVYTTKKPLGNWKAKQLQRGQFKHLAPVVPAILTWRVNFRPLQTMNARLTLHLNRILLCRTNHIWRVTHPVNFS